MDIFDELGDVAILDDFLAKEQLVLIFKDQIAVRELAKGGLHKEHPEFFEGLHGGSHSQVGILQLVEDVLVFGWPRAERQHRALVVVSLPEQVVPGDSARLLVPRPIHK